MRGGTAAVKQNVGATGDGMHSNVETMPDRRCPVCDNDARVSLKFNRNGYLVHLCRTCGVEFLFPQPTDEALSSIYTTNYFLGSESDVAARRVSELKHSTGKLYLDVIASYVRSSHPRLLEIGCGSGDFLAEAQSRGFCVEGLEVSEHAAEVANTRLGKDAVRVGFLEDTSFSEQSYDIVAAFDVIEHVRNPKKTLARIHALLKPGGMVAIVTPSLDSWSRRLLGRHWMEYKPEHITYFSERSLKQLLEETGFGKSRFLPNYKRLTVDYISRHFERFPIPLLTTGVRIFRQLLPDRLAHREFTVVASGTMAIATKLGPDI
jgi:SAM-dependent methyltransferase